LDALEASKQLAYEATEPAEETLEIEQDLEGDALLFSGSIVSATADLIAAISDQKAARPRGNVDGPESRPVSRLAEARDNLLDAEATAAKDRAEEIERMENNKRNRCATCIARIFRGFKARQQMMERRRQRDEELIAERVRRYHETRIPRSHRYVGVPRASLSPWPTSRPSSPGGFASRARSRRTVASPDPDELAQQQAQTHWKLISGVKNAQGINILLNTETERRTSQAEDSEEEEGVESMAFDTTKLLAELKQTEEEPTSPTVLPEVEEDDLDLLVAPTNQPVKKKKKERRTQPATSEKQPSKYKAMAKSKAGVVKENISLKAPVHTAEPETEPPALSSTPTPGQDAVEEEVEVASESSKVPSEVSSHGPLYLKNSESPLSPTCSTVYTRAVDALRSKVQEVFGNTTASPPDKAQDIKDLVEKAYLDACSEWHVKPNSKAVTRIRNAKALFTDANVMRPFITTYDFNGAHLGDRGVICVLLALAHDVCCSNVSLEKCGLHNASAPLIAEFLKLHPSLLQVDLFSNGFSFHAGQLFLRALAKRERPRGSLHDLAAATVCVNLGETALSTTAPTGRPCGVLWGKHGRFAPSEYGKLIDELKGTHRVRYDHVNEFGELPPSPTAAQKRAVLKSKSIGRRSSMDN
jgi:hypothetical protein